MAYRRIQVLIEPSQDDELERRARELGRSKSDLVREAVAVCLGIDGGRAQDPENDAYLSLPTFEGGATDVSANVDHYLYDPERATEADSASEWPPKNDPFFALIGTARAIDGAPDVARNHHRYLDETEAASWDRKRS